MENPKSYTKSKLLWRCHRGMLELDLILQPFVKTYFDGLPQSLRNDFIALIEIDDPTLFGWLLGHEKCEDERYQAIIKRINQAL